jgi:hypothetical protein
MLSIVIIDLVLAVASSGTARKVAMKDVESRLLSNATIVEMILCITLNTQVGILTDVGFHVAIFINHMAGPNMEHAFFHNPGRIITPFPQAADAGSIVLHTGEQ